MSIIMRENNCENKLPSASSEFRVSCCITLILAMLAVGCFHLNSKQINTCVSQNNLEKKEQAPIGQQGNILLVEKPSQALPMQHVFVAAFQFKKNEIEAQELLIVPGIGKIPYSQKCDFQFELVDMRKETLARYGIWNPRRLIADEHKDKGFEIVPTATFVARFPFTAKAMEIRVLNAKNKPLASKDVHRAIKKFCGMHKDHPDCHSLKKSLIQSGTLPVTPPSTMT